MLFARCLYGGVGVEPWEAGSSVAREQYRGLVVMLFYTQRCPVCKRLLRAWKSFVASHRGEAVFLALPYNRHTRRLFEYFEVEELPAIIVVRDGRVIARREGIRRVEEIEALYSELTINTA